MSQLRIKVVAGRESGKRLKLRETEAPIGRGPGNVIRIDEPEVSREHAKLVFDAGQWYLENISRNGTRLDGKTVTKKRRPITEPGVISVGELPILEIVGFDAPEAVPLDDEDDDEAGDQPPAGLSKRSKLWIGIGAYMGLMVLLALFLHYNDQISGEDDDAGSAPLTYLTKDQIAEEIRAPIEQAVTPDPDEALDWITEGREAFSKRKQALNYLYEANFMFKRAQSLVRDDVPGNGVLEKARNRRTIRWAEQELIDAVWEEYDTARRYFRAQDYGIAADGFDRVVQRYPKPDSVIKQNAERFRDRARGLAGKRRR